MFIYLFMLLLRGFYRLMKLFLDWISSNLHLIQLLLVIQTNY